MLFVLAVLLCCINAQTPGTPISFDPKPILAAMNVERKFWKIPILEYDTDLAQIAQYYCEMCNWPVIPPSTERGPLLGRLKGFTFQEKKYQSTGENRAAAAGIGADPSPNQWLNRQDWTCSSNACNASSGCDAYKQIVWKDTIYVGCGKCRCNTTGPSDPFPNDNSPIWDFLVCDFNSAGNYAGEHPFGSDQAAVCAGTYVIPPYSPQPVCKKCNTGCLAPVQGATCDSNTGAWQSTGPISISQITTPVECAYKITGDLTGADSDRLNVTVCGGITVTGTVTLTGTPGLELDYQGVSGLAPGSFQSFLNYTSITGAFKPPVAREVATPLVELCAITVVGDKGSLVYLYDCADATAPNNIPTALPKGGGTKVSQSASSTSFNPANPALGGDINDPDLNTQPKGPLVLPPGAPGAPGAPGSGGGLPGWAIFLIVLAVLIAVAVIIAIIFFLFTSGDNTERF